MGGGGVGGWGGWGGGGGGGGGTIIVLMYQSSKRSSNGPSVVIRVWPSVVIRIITRQRTGRKDVPFWGKNEGKRVHSQSDQKFNQLSSDRFKVEKT